MDPVTLYQFELCPFCHKVKAGLELKGIPFSKVEVNPMGKKELPDLPTDSPRKVPVIEANGELIPDSTAILNYLDARYEGALRFLPADPEVRAKAVAIEQWVDDVLVMALPTVIYGTWREALTAAQVTARTSNFGFFQNMSVRAGGPLIMHQIAKRILKKNDRTDGHQWVGEALDRVEEWLGDEAFVAGPALTLGDVAIHGALSCVRDFPIFEKVTSRPRLSSWFRRVQDLRDEHAAPARG